MFNYCFTFFLILSSLTLRAQNSRIADFFIKATNTNEILVVWVTKAGSTCPNVHVEHSLDSIRFSKVYTYPSICGHSDEEISYSWIDANPTHFAKNYYRINVDDVEFTISRTIDLQSNLKNNETLFFPNPSAGSITLEHRNPKNQHYDLSIFNSSGKLLFNQQNLEGKKHVLKLTDWNDGYYIARILYEDKSAETINFSIVK